MRQNPNFMSNFSDNMTDSMKLAQGNTIENENVRKQFLKYAGGGRGDQYDAPEEREKNQVKFDMLDVKNIKTQQSQVSNIDTGFNKVKGHPAQILNELRTQFDKIRNMPASNVQKNDDKISSSSEQNHSRSNHIRGETSSEISSQKIKQKDTTNNREERLWHVERKQYEYMLMNCQAKIEQLLHAEMEYRKTIHELRSNANIQIKSPAVTKTQSEVKDLQKQLKQEKQKNYLLTTQIQKLRVTIKQQTQKITKIESESNYRYKDESKLQQEKRKLEEYLRLQKDRYMNCEIERRKYQMENELLEKQKEQEFTRVQKQIEHLNVVHELNIKNIAKKYEDQIEIKDRRYRLLLSQFEQLKRDYAVTKEEAERPSNNPNNQMLDIFRRLLEEKKSSQGQQFTKTVHNLIEKLQDKQRSSDDEGEHSRLLEQIRLLRAEIEHLKNNSLQGIDLEPMKKMYEAEIAALKDTIAVLQRKLKNIPKETPQKTNPNTINPFSQVQVTELQRKITELESSQKNSSGALQKLQSIEEQLRGERRRRYQAQFQVSKLQKQLQFRITILTNERQSALRLKQAELDRANTNISYWRQEFDNMRKFFQQKLAEKNRLLQQSVNSVEIVTIQKSYDESLQKARLDYEKQINALAERLSNYNASSLEYDTLFKRYTQLENAYFELQKSVFRCRQTNEAIDHLWYIKETQYGNINEILRQVYGPHRQLNQPQVVTYGTAGGQPSVVTYGAPSGQPSVITYGNQSNQGNQPSSPPVLNQNQENNIFNALSNAFNPNSSLRRTTSHQGPSSPTLSPTLNANDLSRPSIGTTSSQFGNQSYNNFDNVPIRTSVNDPTTYRTSNNLFSNAPTRTSTWDQAPNATYDNRNSFTNNYNTPGSFDNSYRASNAVY